MSEFEIFEAARKLSDHVARNAYLDSVCADDSQLRAAVEKLLATEPLPELILGIPDGSAGEPTLVRSPEDDPLQDDVPDARSAHLKGDSSVMRIVAGKYKLLQRIGEGGMGEVYAAEQLSPRRKVAVKLIRAGRDSKSILTRFAAERQAIALMDHPNVARFYDDGTTESGEPFFVMELIHGKPITTYCDENRLTVNERIELFIPVCLAIEHAHQKGIIHRDIKSTNILVAQYDGVPVPKVIDFGLAKAVGSPLVDETSPTLFGDVVGTLGYMAPEQATANQLEVDSRSDIFSLAAVLYELLTGTTPHAVSELRNRALLEILRVVREEEPPAASHRLSSSGSLPALAVARRTDPRRLVGHCRGQLDLVIQKALARERGRRYRHSGEFADDLRRFLDHEPVLAAPPTLGDRMSRWVRKRWPYLAAAMLLLVSVAISAIGYSVQEVRRVQAEILLKEEQSRRRVADIQKIAATERAALKEREAISGEYTGLMGQVAREEQQRSRGWVERSEKHIRRAASLHTPVRVDAELRSAAAQCLIADEYRTTPDWELKDDVRLMAFSKSGKTLAATITSSNQNPRAQVWLIDTATGVVRQRLEAKDNRPSLKTFQERGIFSAVRSSLTHLAFTNDDRALVAGTKWGRLVRWDLSTSPPKSKDVSIGSSRVYLLVSGDGRRCVIWCHETAQLECRDTTTLERIGVVAPIIDGTFVQPFLSPIDDAVIIYNNRSPYVEQPKAYRLGTWEERPVVPADAGLAHPAGSVTVRDRVVWEASAPRLLVYDGTDGKPFGFFELSPETSAGVSRPKLEELRFSPDGSVFAWLSQDRPAQEVSLWDAGGGAARWRLPIDRNDGQALIPAISATGERIAVGGKTGIQQFSRLRPNLAQTRQPGHPQGVSNVVSNPLKPEIAITGSPSGGGRDDVYHWHVDPASGAMRKGTPLVLARQPAVATRSVSYSPQGTYLVAAGHSSADSLSLLIRDLANSTELPSITVAREPKMALKRSFDPDRFKALGWASGDRLVAAFEDDLFIWKLGSSPELAGRHHFGDAFGGFPAIAAMSIRGRDTGYVLLEDASLIEFQVHTNEIRPTKNRTPPGTGAGRAVELSPDHRWAAIGRRYGEVVLYDAKADRFSSENGTGHADAVTALAWINEKRLASGSTDGTVTVWIVSSTGELDRWYTVKLRLAVTGLAILPGGERLLVACPGDTAVRSFDLTEIENSLRDLHLQ